MGEPLSIFSSRPLLTLVVLVALVLGLDRGLSRGLGHVVDDSRFRYARVFTDAVAADVVVLGNSRAVHSLYAPELTRDWCRPVMNLAYNGMPMRVQDIVLDRLLASDTPPKIVVLEVTAALSPPASTTELTSFASGDARLMGRIAPDADHLIPWYDVFHLLAFNNELFWRALYYRGRDDQTWINRRSPISAASVRAVQANPPRDFDIAPGAPAALARITAAADAAGVPLVLFVAPYHDSLLARVPAAATWADTLSTTSHPVRNLTRALAGDTDFTDPLHMNIQGARATAALLLDAHPDLSACPAPIH